MLYVVAAVLDLFLRDLYLQYIGYRLLLFEDIRLNKNVALFFLLLLSLHDVLWRLYYGTSLTLLSFWRKLNADLHQRFPNVDVSICLSTLNCPLCPLCFCKRAFCGYHNHIFIDRMYLSLEKLWSLSLNKYHFCG